LLSEHSLKAAGTDNLHISKGTIDAERYMFQH